MEATSTVRGVASAAPRTALHATARALAERGWAVFPVVPQGKVPATRHGCKDATTDAATVDRWWTSCPDYNIGVATGRASGLVCVDLDGEAGVQSFQLLQRLHGSCGSTAWARTGSGGWHCYYRYPEHASVRNSAGRLGAGIDVRGDGGYVVAPPSVHPSGGRYEWVQRVRPAPLPEWLVWLLDPPPPPPRPWTPPPSGGSGRYAAAALEGEAAAVAQAKPGTRNETLNRAAFALGTLVGAGRLDAGHATAALLDAARACGLADREAETTIASGLAAGQQHPRTT